MKRLLFLIIFLVLVSSAFAFETDVDFGNGAEVSVIVILNEKPVQKNFGILEIDDDHDFDDDRNEFLEKRRVKVKEQQDKVMGKLFQKKGFGILSQKKEKKFHRFAVINGFTGKISRAEMALLENDPAVKGVYLDKTFSVALNGSVGLINSSEVNSMVQNYSTNLNGTGQTVCVIDTGVDYNHTALGGGWGNRVLDGYDYCGNGGGTASSPDCGSSDTDPWDNQGHGTHVAGIIASGNDTYRGVAPGVNLVALKACDSDGDCSSAAMASSIDWCVNNSATYNISVISMSIGSSTTYNSSSCPSTLATEINTAVGSGLVFVVSSGNTASKTGISSPACLGNATSVGSVGNADTIASYSNSVASLDLLAPGGASSGSGTCPDANRICSTNDGGGFISMSGTSMAAPHVSGAIALLNQYKKLISNTTYNSSEVESILKSTGENKTDSNNVSTPRIDIYAAILNEDNITPSAAYISPTPSNNSAVALDSVTIKVNVSETVNATLQFDNINYSMTLVSGAVYQREITSLNKSNHTFMVYLTDLANNNNTLGLRTVEINNSAPNITSYTPNSSNVSVVEQGSLFFNHSSTDPEGDTLSYFWYLNGSQQSTNSSWNYTSNCSSAGDYNVTLVVSDSSLNTSQAWNLTVNNTNCAPTAYILTSNNTVVELGALVSLTTNSSDPDGDTLNYSWNVGDGTVLNDTNVTHNYSLVANYTVVLTVNDSALASNYSINVVVNDSTAPSISSTSPSNVSSSSSSTTSINVTFTSNENATCRYNVSSASFSFADGILLNGSGTTTHWVVANVSSGTTYNYYVKCNDSYGNTNSGSYHLQFSVASVSSSSSGGGGGGGSSTASASTKKSFYYSTMNQGQNYDLVVGTDKIAFTQMSLTPSENLNAVDITVMETVNPPQVLSDVYKYIQITLKNINDNQITQAVIQFKVNKTWLSQNNYDYQKVSLHRYEGGVWNKLTATLINEDTNYYNYQASVPGFSYFSITAEKLVAAATAPAPIVPAPEDDFAVQAVEESPKPINQVSGAQMKDLDEDGLSLGWYLLLLIPAAAVVFLLIHFTQNKKGNGGKKNLHHKLGLPVKKKDGEIPPPQVKQTITKTSTTDFIKERRKHLLERKKEVLEHLVGEHADSGKIEPGVDNPVENKNN